MIFHVYMWKYENVRAASKQMILLRKKSLFVFGKFFCIKISFLFNIEITWAVLHMQNRN